MPDIDGPTLVDAARSHRPAMGVVFMSGYAEEIFRGEGRIVDGDVFIAKPFALRDLVGAVKRAAQARRGRVAGDMKTLPNSEDVPV